MSRIESEWEFDQFPISKVDLVHGIEVKKPDEELGVAVWFDEDRRMLLMTSSKSVDKNNPEVTIPSIKNTLVSLSFHSREKVWIPRMIETRTHTVQRDELMRVFGELGVYEGEYLLSPDVIFMSNGDSYTVYINPYKIQPEITPIPATTNSSKELPLDYSDLPPQALLAINQEDKQPDTSTLTLPAIEPTMDYSKIEFLTGGPPVIKKDPSQQPGYGGLPISEVAAQINAFKLAREEAKKQAEQKKHKRKPKKTNT